MRGRPTITFERLLPKPPDSIGVKDRFVADDRYIFGLRLSDQHTIKWILVRTWQKARSNGMCGRNSHPLEPLAFDLLRKVRH